MSHVETYRRNEAYAEFLANWDAAFYGKYAAALRPEAPGGPVLDVGCGVGQVVGRLTGEGVEAWGVDVSEPNIVRARAVCPHCQVYEGARLPFPDRHFAAVGALNVLEHVEEPEAFLTELVRVAAPGGRVIVSSPNFLRMLGPGYHPRMHGLARRWRNLRQLLRERRQRRIAPGQFRFERMAPIARTPFQPDDDAIIVTSGPAIAFFLQRSGCQIERIECTDRVVARPMEWLLNATPLRHAMFNAFVVARRM